MMSKKLIGKRNSIRFTLKVAFIEFVFFLRSLHREALKQSATDPSSGKIDVNILTTGLSANARKKRGEISLALKQLIESKGKVNTINYQKTFNEFKQGSVMVSEFCIVEKLVKVA